MHPILMIIWAYMVFNYLSGAPTLFLVLSTLAGWLTIHHISMESAKSRPREEEEDDDA